MIDDRVGSTRTADLTGLLRQCVQCGLCLPHCATWLATGDEVHSPRGRLVLLEEMLNGSGTPPSAGDDSFLQAFDQCIGCRACETACPSGVPFSLLAFGQEQAANRLPAASPVRPDPAVPGVVLRRLDQPGFLAGLGKAAGWARAVMTLAGGRNWRRYLEGRPAGLGRLARLVGSVPASPATDASLLKMLDELCGREEGPASEPLIAENPTGRTVAWFSGCANAGLLGATSRRARELLEAAGCRLVDIPGQDCCGALAAHTGRPGRAADLRRRNREAIGRAVHDDAVVAVEAAGCGHELKTRVGEMADRVTDLAVLLAGLPLPPRGETPLKVVYHDPCHARHGQGIFVEPRRLLAGIPGLTILETVEGEVCCGSGGAWGLRYPEISSRLAVRKAANLAATGADLVVTSNPGCLGQIADALRIVAPDLPILPLTDLLWYAVHRA
jgi:glycolate oxidase iron-sulfur subunit